MKQNQKKYPKVHRVSTYCACVNQTNIFCGGQTNVTIVEIKHENKNLFYEMYDVHQISENIFTHLQTSWNMVAQQIKHVWPVHNMTLLPWLMCKIRCNFENAVKIAAKGWLDIDRMLYCATAYFTAIFNAFLCKNAAQHFGDPFCNVWSIITNYIFSLEILKKRENAMKN